MPLDNALAHYYEQVRETLRDLLPARPDSTSGTDFTPGVELPDLTPAMRDYLSVSSVAHRPMPSYEGKDLALLDLTGNPGTQTTKTFASLVIVARAIRYIQDTGERVSIITPSSANKAIALRDAVLRALRAGLVRPDQLNVTAVVPAGSLPKLRASELYTDPELRVRNPVAVHPGPVPGDVKTLARTVVEQHGAEVAERGKTNLWYTLQLENYLAADVVRALAEEEFFPAAPGEPRLHAHAVSSAYGLLGHALGRQRLPGGAGDRTPAHYFLVQHLGAPDMVLSLYGDGSPEPLRAPRYTYDATTGLHTQRETPRFPAVTFDPQEVLDTTFYTRNPPTSARMNELIRGQGGGGIVVSLTECLQRYGQVRALLGEAGLRLPANPTEVREWSLIMAVTGVLNAVDRGLVPQRDILVHGSGTYAARDFEVLPAAELHHVADADALRDVVLAANAL